MAITYDKELLEQVINAQLEREKMYDYPHNMIWLALAKNTGEAFDFYFRQDKHYIKELGDTLVNILMILEIEGVDIEETINKSLIKTKESIDKTLNKNGNY